MVSRWACIRLCSRSRLRSKVTWYSALSTFGISQKSFLLPGKWLRTDQTLSFPSLTSPSLCPFGFVPHRHPNPQIHGTLFVKWLWVCAVSSATAHIWWNSLSNFLLYSTVWRSVYVRSLYEAPLHSPSRPSIRQLDLMSKSWNELLRHWRSGLEEPSTNSLLLLLLLLALSALIELHQNWHNGTWARRYHHVWYMTLDWQLHILHIV